MHMLLTDPKCAQVQPLSLAGGHRRGGHAQVDLRCGPGPGGIDVFTGYGMSETCPILSLAHLSDAELGLERDA